MHPTGLSSCLEPVMTGNGHETEKEKATKQWVLFVVDDQTYALEIWETERILRAVEIKPLPESPPHVLGVVNVRGEVLPVIDLRARFGRRQRPIGPDDYFIVARVLGRSIVLPVDAVHGSVEVPEDTSFGAQRPQSRCVRKVIPLGPVMAFALNLRQVAFPDGAVLDLWLSPETQESLTA